MKKFWKDFLDFLDYRFIEKVNDNGELVFYLDLWMILLIVLGFIVVYFFLRVVKKLLTRKMDHEDKLKFNSVFKFFSYIAYIFLFLVVLSTSGIDLTAVLTASAAVFVAIGFALQDLFKDIIAGIFIIVDKSLQVNDIIEIDGKVGRVFEIKLRTTRALTRDDKVVIIPNHLFMTETLFNYTQNHETTRESVRVGVAYGTDTSKVKEILEACAMDQMGVLKSPKPFALFENFGDSSLDFVIYFFIRDSFVDPRIKSEMRFRIDERFRQHNITIPFPQRDVHILSQ